MGLSPIAQTTLADEVEKRVRAFIRENNYQPGDALPGELELAERLGVSRNVLREALSRLRMLGLVESRKRRGMVVGRPNLFLGLERVIETAWFSPDETAHLRELRLVLELGMAELVCQRCTEADLEALDAIAEQEGAATGLEERLAADHAFHKRLFEMSGNPLLSRFQGLLDHFFAIQVQAEGEPPRQPIPAERSHHHIIDAVRTGDPAALRSALANHLSVYAERNSQ